MIVKVYYHRRSLGGRCQIDLFWSQKNLICMCRILRSIFHYFQVRRRQIIRHCRNVSRVHSFHLYLCVTSWLWHRHWWYRVHSMWSVVYYARGSISTIAKCRAHHTQTCSISFSAKWWKKIFLNSMWLYCRVRDSLS